jgi:hypothetical protein
MCTYTAWPRHVESQSVVIIDSIEADQSSSLDRKRVDHAV